MQALVWIGPRQMEMQEQPVPEPKAGEVLLRVAAAGVCGSELSGYLGQNSLRVPPLVMGHEFAGTIEALGSGVDTIAGGASARVGERVVVNPLLSCGACDLCAAGHANLCRSRQIVGIHSPGGFADFVVVSASLCHVVPAHLDDCRAALAEPFACGIRSVAQARLNPGEPLLILGAGPIGILALVAAREAGAGPIAITDTSAQRLDVAAELGASQTIDASQVDVLAEVKRFTDGRGVPAAIDAVGLTATREQAIRAVRPGGRAVFIGLHHEMSEIAANYVVRQEIEIAGAFAYTPDEFARAVALLGEGAVPAGAWLVERGLGQGGEVFAELVDGAPGYVKATLRPRM